MVLREIPLIKSLHMLQLSKTAEQRPATFLTPFSIVHSVSTNQYGNNLCLIDMKIGAVRCQQFEYKKRPLRIFKRRVTMNGISCTSTVAPAVQLVTSKPSDVGT